ncbi:MAG TPA: hypothetical protein VFE78_35540 [Gemmataceae bacterium]|jgi:hypothetical protein|nr:hypothetical protein [Gemmataceae bacterium]
MVRRFLCLSAVVLTVLLSVPACGPSKPTNKPPTVSDPEGGAVPRPAGKAG